MKMHLNLATRDLDASVAFYRTLLAAKPAKHYADYALFLTDDPGLELALDADPAATASERAHYGIAVERSETCCYAVQTKVWASDPDGRRWETYVVLEEVEVRDDGASTRCGSETRGAACATVCSR